MGFSSVGELVRATEETGASWTSFVHKTGGPASFGAGRWADMSMGAGTPKYNAYVGSQATATPLAGSGNDGINTGPVPSVGQQKRLTGLMLQSSSATLVPATFMLCDYLMHYPLIDGDSTDLQELDNTQSLPRGGANVMAMVVCTTPMTSNAIMTVSYTNSAGVSGRTSVSSLIASSVVGCIVSGSNSSGAAGSVSPFIPLDGGDVGIRSVESVTLTTGAGGFFALVLVRPLVSTVLLETGVAAETSLFTQRASLPVIQDGAFLNFIYLAGRSGTAVPFRAGLDFAWG